MWTVQDIRGAWAHHPRWREATITAVAAALYLLGASLDPDAETLVAPPASAYLVAALSCAVLPIRHRSPRTTIAVATGGACLGPALDFQVSPLLLAPVMIAVFSLATRSERRETVIPVALAMGLPAASAMLFAAQPWQEAGTAVTLAFFPVLAAVLGTSVRNRRAVIEERARRAEMTRENEAHRRVVEERMRIARDLHDVVAHHITLVHAQASVASLFFDSSPDKARESLDQLTENTSDALNELRATVGLLRRSEDPDTPLDPAPGLADLPALVESFQRAGLTVSVHRNGPTKPLSPGVDLTAYRIVQEALTNVTKHAGTATARVDLTYAHDGLTLTVTDDGGHTTPAGSDDSTGHGLTGMRERATAVGGRLSAGRRPEGGYRVTAELPMPASRNAATTGSASEDHRPEPDGEDVAGGRTPS
ncbi:signal transduction histidine kinase [Haloactinopolyspora alba]|uniref:histidine kinase n=1 Tax=Haloactinopolyspora alba TaxID=648780 RepID=A0A2P8DXX8_9ACTN|nr:sensor histidine kinase [Haloactinopolyspora alba]PSL02085.1 signal transduction histidine kinase [Haloactinopolyspora alba]